MSVNIILYNTLSDPIKINKALTQVAVLTGYVNETIDHRNPIITIEYDISPNFNYVYIPDFDRYYYVIDCLCLRANIWQISLRCDVLMSFNIDSVTGIVIETQNVHGDNYLQSGSYVTKVKDKTDIINFPYGLLDNGEFILITAGG